MTHEVLEDQIRSLIREVEHSELPDTSDANLDLERLPRSKIRSMFLYQLLKVLGTKFKELVAEIGSDRVYNALLSIAGQTDSEYADSLIKERISELRKIKPELQFEGLDTLWDKFLLLLGLYPYYSKVLESYFGNDGLISIAILLKSLAEGRLDISVPFYFLERTDHES